MAGAIVVHVGGFFSGVPALDQHGFDPHPHEWLQLQFAWHPDPSRLWPTKTAVSSRFGVTIVANGNSADA